VGPYQGFSEIHIEASYASVLDLGQMYAKDRQTDVRCTSLLNAPAMGVGHKMTAI